MNQVKIFLKKNEQLYLEKDKREYEVHVKKCFPWSHSRKYLSFRDHEDNEVFLLTDVKDLGDDSRKTLEAYLDRNDFIQVITEILGIDEGVEFRNFRVRTESGNHCFQTRLDEWPKQGKEGAIFLKDINGDLFKIENPKQLSSKSYKMIETFI